MLLNASGLELAIEREIDFERELKGIGVANVAAGLMGGLGRIPYPVRDAVWHGGLVLRVRRRALDLAATLMIVLFFGADVLSYLPIGLFAAVVFFLGFDLLLTAYYDHGMMMPRVELAIVVAMPVIALVFGFMVAVGFGVSVAALLFVIAYSREWIRRRSAPTAPISTHGSNGHPMTVRCFPRLEPVSASRRSGGVLVLWVCQQVGGSVCKRGWQAGPVPIGLRSLM